jgi:hypothetical protein
MIKKTIKMEAMEATIKKLHFAVIVSAFFAWSVD